MKKLLTKMLIVLTVIIGIVIIAYFLFVNFYPSFGGDISAERQLKYRQSKHYKDGKFVNINASAPEKREFWDNIKLAYKFFSTKVHNGRPTKDLKVEKLDTQELINYDKEARLFWYGHSAFLLQIAGKNILLDPMFGQVAAPHKLLGANRFNKNLPLEIQNLPKIDAIILSHDHYDHLDYATIIKLKDKTEHFFTPLGVGVHLETWDVPPENITELDWWEEVNFKNLKLVCTPAQHFSGRKLDNGQSTLWSSWVIKSEKESIFFSGDGGYASHFKEIGNKYGEFDIALLECGQYNEMWKDIHCMPEETAQAGVDLKAKKIMPIHWASFKLALHDWKDPIVRVCKKAKELELPIITPKIGEEIIVKDTKKLYSDWWDEY